VRNPNANARGGIFDDATVAAAWNEARVMTGVAHIRSASRCTTREAVKDAADDPAARRFDYGNL
jgi:hypothetical protein